MGHLDCHWPSLAAASPIDNICANDANCVTQVKQCHWQNANQPLPPPQESMKMTSAVPYRKSLIFQSDNVRLSLKATQSSTTFIALHRCAVCRPHTIS
ncbi:hypothetical protein E2320_007156 [Naja naja]|nr:hypothetical protein E2320_007156 [Naja naja]